MSLVDDGTNRKFASIANAEVQLVQSGHTFCNYNLLLNWSAAHYIVVLD